MRMKEAVKKTSCQESRFLEGSLTQKMFKSLLSGLAVGLYLAMLLYFGGMGMLQQYLFDYYAGEAELLAELGELARQNQVGATDAGKLLPWIEEKGIREFQVAREGWLLFDASYPGAILPGRKEQQPGNGWRTYHNIMFADGDANVYISTGFDEKYYRVLLAVSALSGFAACMGIVLLGMKENVAYIQCLEREVDAIKRGSLQEAVTVKGQDELGQLACGLDQMRQQLYENMQKEKELRAAQEKLVLGMSHDLRTPLTGLLAYMEVLKKQERGGRPSRVYIDKAYDKILQIRRMSDQLFEYFLIDSGKEAVLEPPEEISSAVGDYLSELCAMLTCGGFVVDAGELEWKPVFVQVNTDYLGRIMNNIFSNIEKYGDKGQDVKIWMDYGQDRVGIAISNRMAMPGRYVEGTGIGVKNVSSMMEQMGGVAEEGMLGDWYRITLYFPVH